MSLASTSTVVVNAIKETVFGVTPTTGNPTEIRITGESLEYNISKEASKEINTDRGSSSMVPVDASATGGLNAEMHYAGLDMFLESVMQSTYSAFGTNGVGVATSVDATTTTLTAAVAPTGSSAFTTLKKGQWFRLSSAGGNSGKILRVSTVTAPTSTVLTLDVNTPAVASTGESVQIQTSRLTHGTTQTSFTLERLNADIGVYMAFKGMTPSKMSLKVANGSLSETTFDFMGKSALENTATMLPGTVQAAPTYDVHSGVAGATNAIWMDGVPVTGTYVKSVNFDFDNSLRNQGAIGSLGAVGIGSGSIKCTLAMQVYFANKDLFTKFRTNANSSVIFATTDAAGNGYIFTVPVANISTYKSNASAKDNDQMLDITVTALIDKANADAGLRKMVFIDRIGNSVA